MEIEIKQGGIQTAEADTIVVNLFEGVTVPSGATGAVDQALQGAIKELIDSGDLSGKAGELVALYSAGQSLLGGCWWWVWVKPSSSTRKQPEKRLPPQP